MILNAQLAIFVLNFGDLIRFPDIPEILDPEPDFSKMPDLTISG
jgi:hypothetical protein